MLGIVYPAGYIPEYVLIAFLISEKEQLSVLTK
jgi:hypothetical protein